MSNKKVYVLDTNILMENPHCLLGFKDNDIVITDITIEELDNNKNGPGDRNRNARIASRIIKNLLQNNPKSHNTVMGIEGVQISNDGGMLAIVSFRDSFDITETADAVPDISQTKKYKDFPLDLTKADNRIIFSAYNIASKVENNCVLITNDTNMFIKASALGIKVQDYENEHEPVDRDSLYKGRGAVVLDDESFTLFTTQGCIPVVRKEGRNGNIICSLGDNEDSIMYFPSVFVENKYFLVINKKYKENEKNSENERLGIYQDGMLKLIKPKAEKIFGVKARNKGQIFALDALTRPVDEIPLVILKGPAGSAKTFLSLAAGLNDADILQYEGRYNAVYKKVMITRANVLSDRDLGALPGDKEEKMRPLIAPFLDNLVQLLRRESKEDDENINIQVEDLLTSGSIEIESIAYMRGRSIADTFLIVDEAQNCTRNQMLELITRVGEGTKIVICGDPDQIDNPKLDKYNNGLTFVSEQMKGSKLCAQVTFESDESVRSALATEAAERLVLR